MTSAGQENTIRSRPSPNCCLCGQPGKRLYEGTRDWIFDAPGQWNFDICANPDCGLVWLNPMPLEEDIAKAYQTYYTHQASRTLANRVVQYVKTGYLATRYGYCAGTVPPLQKCLGLLAYLALFRRAGLDFLVAYLQALPRGRLLDVGCGDGQIVQFMQNVGWQAEGVDFDPGAVDNAVRKGLRIHLGTLQSQAYPENSFEAIVMSHFLEHIHEPAELLAECHRILKPGGRLVVLTPNIGSWGHEKFQGCWRGLEPPRHLHIFNSRSLNRLALRTGFRKVIVNTTLRNGGKILLASRAIRRTGRFNPYARRDLLSRLWVTAMQLVEWTIWKLNPDRGEELDMIAEK